MWSSTTGNRPHDLETIAIAEAVLGETCTVHGLAIVLDQHPFRTERQSSQHVVDGTSVLKIGEIGAVDHEVHDATVVAALPSTVMADDPMPAFTADPVVSFIDVHRSFGGVMAVDGLSFEVRRGEVTVLLGPNGAGKTTALRMVTGALLADSGTLRVLGLDPDKDGQAVRAAIGVVSAKPALYDRLSGWDNLRYAAELWNLGPKAPIAEAADRFGIGSALHKRVGGYSTGMKTRLALARAILHDPELLLLDEPTSGLDPESSQAVLGLIDEMAASGKTVIMCTHLLLEAEGLADHVVMLQDGKAAVAGSPEALVRRYWPDPEVLLDAEDQVALAHALMGDGLPTGVLGIETPAAPRTGVSLRLDRIDRVGDIVAGLSAAGVRLTRVVPHEPTLEELYLTVRRTSGGYEPEAHGLPEVRR